MNIKKITLFVCLFAASQAFAGAATSLMQTAAVQAPGEFEIKVQNDIIFNAGGGLNISPHLLTGLIENFLDLDVYFGTGKTEFQVGALTKYNLLPDVPGQAALAFTGGLTYINNFSDADCKNCVLLSTGMLVSKSFETEFGKVTPYGALQPELLMGSNSALLITALVGSKWQFQQTAPWNFYSEFAASLRYAHWYLGIGAGYPF
jgi:hypothetical protein